MQFIFLLLLSLFYSANTIESNNNFANLDTNINSEKSTKTFECFCSICNEIYSKTKVRSIKTNDIFKTPKKNYTVMVYVAGDNDLKNFAIRNLKQATGVGSNENVNIIFHLDIRTPDNKKISRFYYIEKNKIIELDVYDEKDLPMNSGNPYSLITFCSKAAEYFPADNYVLILWNHGTGACHPEKGKVVNPSQLFSFNPKTNKLDLDRSISYLDLVDQQINNSRGICWDDSTGDFLTNEQMADAVKVARSYFGKKLAILGFDACLMGMIEIARLVKEDAEFMVSSQEVELGTGWNYFSILYPLTQKNMSPQQLAEHMVTCYNQSYNAITNDYTLSAIDLTQTGKLEQAIDTTSSLLLEAINLEKENSVRKAILQSKDKRNCTHFDEPSYIDLHHFCKNLFKQISGLKFKDRNAGTIYRAKLRMALKTILAIIENSVTAYTCGKNLKNARGISIYYPYARRVHPSYKKSDFFQNNNWGKLITI